MPPVWIIELTKFGRWTEAQNASLGVEDVSVKNMQKYSNNLVKATVTLAASEAIYWVLIWSLIRVTFMHFFIQKLT